MPTCRYKSDQVSSNLVQLANFRVADDPPTKHRVVETEQNFSRFVNPVKYLPHENYVYGQIAEESEEGRMDLRGLA